MTLSAKRMTVGVIFGSRSVEHDVSIVSAQQVIKALDRAKYDVVPIYITRDGKWLTGDTLANIDVFKNDVTQIAGVRETTLSTTTQMPGLITPPVVSGLFARSQFKKLDVIFPVVHGSHGEDGTLQGLFELVDIPYVGAGVAASAVANDKVLTKSILAQYGLNVVDWATCTRHEWLTEKDRVLKRLEKLGELPFFVKPATLGSSIGVAMVKTHEEMLRAIDLALNFDRRVLIEQALTGAIEINCAVMGNDIMRPSVLEQPVTYEQFLSFNDKYMRGSTGMKGADRVIPAPLEPVLTGNIRQMAVDTFRAVHGCGTARIDFLVKDGVVYVNEINTMPGSLAFYLWAEEKMSAEQVCDELIRLAIEAHTEKRRTTYDYKSGLVKQAAARGLKGVKGSKH